MLFCSNCQVNFCLLLVIQLLEHIVLTSLEPWKFCFTIMIIHFLISRLNFVAHLCFHLNVIQANYFHMRGKKKNEQIYIFCCILIFREIKPKKENFNTSQFFCLSILTCLSVFCPLSLVIQPVSLFFLSFHPLRMHIYIFSSH